MGGTSGSLNCLVVGDRMLWFERQSARLSGSGNCFKCEDVLLREALADEFFKVLSEAPTMDGFVPNTVVVVAVLFCSGDARGRMGWVLDA